MTKLIIRHESLPVSYTSKSAFRRHIETIYGIFYYSTPSFVMTKFENSTISIVAFILLILLGYGCKNYVLPLVYLLKKLIK